MEALAPNDQIGSYRVVRPLGRGGMGDVYEVVHVKLGVHYALKTFTLDHGQVRLLKERFLAEGRVLARLRHPHLVRVFDLDVDEATQTPYFVMDLVQYKDGESYTLADIEPGGADEEHIARWFGQLCSALDYIHAEGIVHRDIKLNNILLDSQGGVVLSDFGVSRFSDDRLRRELDIGNTMASSAATTGKLIMGTAGYMAPEIGHGADATPAADVYSLGVSFFRLLTGVWYGESPNIWQLLDPFADAWREVLQAMLSKDPAMRPVPLAPAAARVAAACEIGTSGDIGTSGEVECRPQPRPSRFRLKVVSVAAALVIGLGALAAWWFFHDNELPLDDLYSIPSAAPEM